MRSSETRNLSIDEPSLPEGTCKETLASIGMSLPLITLLNVNAITMQTESTARGKEEHARSLAHWDLLR